MKGPLKNLREPLKLLSESDVIDKADPSELLGRDRLFGEFHLERTTNAKVLICGSSIEKVTSILFREKDSSTNREIKTQDWDTILDALNEAVCSEKLSSKMEEMGEPDYQLVINEKFTVSIWKSKIMKCSSYCLFKLHNTLKAKLMMALLDHVSKQ